MTKSQEDVVRAALEILDERGAAGVSMRTIADRLGVRMNTVLWHTKSKARLEELMADAIVATASLENLPRNWRPRATELISRYRQALLAHRDGALVVAGTHTAEPATLDFAEALVAALLAGGLPDREAAWSCWSLVYFTLGLTQEEQATPPGLTEPATLATRPALARTAPALFTSTFNERFDYGIARLLH